jgi:hypothetical protein
MRWLIQIASPHEWLPEDMSWKPRLFKPKWEHKDPLVRLDAVAHFDDPELESALPSILINDEDSDVRIAAARKISDLPLLSKAQASEQNPEALGVLAQRISNLTASVLPERPSLDARLAVVTDSQDRQLLELVASQAPEPELRELALSKITRQGFLGDRAVGDENPGLRRFAASRITQHSTLRRVIGELRKSDKTLHQELTERLHAELLEALNPAAAEIEALKLCEALEAYALKHIEAAESVPAEISGPWGQIESVVSADLKLRFQSIVGHLSEARAVDIPEPEESSAEISAEDPPEQATDVAPEPERKVAPQQNHLVSIVKEIETFAQHSGDSPSIGKLRILRAKWDRTWSGLAQPSDVEIEQGNHCHTIFNKLQALVDSVIEGKNETLDKVESLAEKLGRQLEDGELHKALETRNLLIEMGKPLRSEARWKAVNRQINAHHGRLKELRDWLHWSNDKIRKQLIAEMEILPETDLHPDAILDRVKALQKRWKDLESSEQIPGDSHYHAAPWMWRKFNGAGHKAFEATKPYLEKRDEIRDKHLQKQKELCDQVFTAASAENPDWNALTKLLQTVRKEMRDLDLLPHKLRKKALSKLRKALDKGNNAMQAHYAEIEKQKLKLIRAASQLSFLEDKQEAISEAKRLQAEWKTAGRLWRSRENELWEAFREPLDPLFGKLKEEQEASRAEIRERLKAQESLCEEMKSLLDLPEDALLESQGKVQGLRDSWRDIEQPNKRLQGQFVEMAKAFDQRVKDLQKGQSKLIRDNRWLRAKLVQDLETGCLKGAPTAAAIKKAEAKWPGSSTEAIDLELEARFRNACKGESKATLSNEASEKASALCIQLEFLAGLASPEAEKSQRMKYQVDRLSRSLSGESRQLSAKAEAMIAEDEWLTLPLLGKKAYQEFEKRIKAALKEIYEDNSV